MERKKTGEQEGVIDQLRQVSVFYLGTHSEKLSQHRVLSTLHFPLGPSVTGPSAAFQQQQLQLPRPEELFQYLQESTNAK